jgi:cell division protein ZapA (FtsZ GTPase activity inhibitor)
MSEITIKVSISNRVYPLKIKFSEEENVRKAAALINDKIKEFEENYAVRDKQDLLAMSCLQFATSVVNNEGKKNIESEGVEEKLKEIDLYIGAYLQDIDKK